MKIMKRIFGPKREEVKKAWRNLCNENIHNLYLNVVFVADVEEFNVDEKFSTHRRDNKMYTKF
jgi:hypothetical protein